MFQLRFYALVVHRATGAVPDRLQLLYLGSGEVLTYQPDPEDLRRAFRTETGGPVEEAIKRAAETQDWRPRASKKCRWCSHQALCPEFGELLPRSPTSRVWQRHLRLRGDYDRNNRRLGPRPHQGVRRG